MGDIIRMPQKLREKIAAGEVITAPVSVVKELIENSIDAGADEIRVYIEGGGKRLIRVVDNGKGMDADDLRMCAQRFTTSKMHNEGELETVRTLGFRGEALASIATVSELSIQSIKEGAREGFIANYDDGGIAGELEGSSITKGTIIEVRNLFGKFPVRLKFLKSDDVEGGKIVNLVMEYSLSSHNIAFQLYKDSKVVFNSPKGSPENKIFQAFGREIAENVIGIEHEADGISVRGFISKVGYARKTRDYQLVFINGRLVKNRGVIDAVERGYTNKIFLGRHPIAILYITLDPSLIDVNIHPTKQEIKFKNEYVVEDVVMNAVQKGISQSSHAISVEADGKMRIAAHVYEQDKGKQMVLSVDAGKETQKAKQMHISQSPRSELLDIEILGQVNRTYIIGYDRNSLVLVDQHAAQERVFYERFLAQLAGKSLSVNELIKPYVFLVNDKEEKVIERHTRVLERYGFQIEQASRKEYALSTVPAVFGKAGLPEMVRDVIDELGVIGESATIDDEIDQKIATRACRKAIKGGDILSINEMKSLLNALAGCKNPYTCPHGRPTILRMSWGDLEKKFKRTD